MNCRRFLPCALLVSMLGCAKAPPPVQPPEPPVVTVTNPIEQDLESYTEFTGRLRAAREVEIRAQVNGYLKKVNFTDGALVKAGDVLYEIDPEPYEAALKSALATVEKTKADIATAESQYRQAASEFDRAEKSKAALSAEEFDKRRATKEAAEAVRTSAKAATGSAEAAVDKARFDRKNCTIRVEIKDIETKVNAGENKPILARVSRTLITEGNLVQAGQTLLCKITSTDPIHAYWDTDERTSLMYQKLVAKAEIPDPRTANTPLKCWIGRLDDEGYPYEGYVDYIAPEIVRGTGSREVRAVFRNPPPYFQLSPGNSVRVRVEAGKPKKSITVPEIAIGSQQRQKFVYVVNDKDEVEFRAVVLGPLRQVGRVSTQIVESGVTAKDRVIVNGLLRVRPGVKVNPKVAGS